MKCEIGAEVDAGKELVVQVLSDWRAYTLRIDSA